MPKTILFILLGVYLNSFGQFFDNDLEYALFSKQTELKKELGIQRETKETYNPSSSSNRKLPTHRTITKYDNTGNLKKISEQKKGISNETLFFYDAKNNLYKKRKKKERAILNLHILL
ncbi:hypothetical protein [Aquimarina sp. RZ0]|uniref:hypothetical protein n=1 Tax=Aquimarina sp. RZ0 TaxID=2607730 RepID=UPI0011F28CA4|nr:hypothetical protein [Aquimarina sp. RZ0]KAA1245396.1 hypothetical protein F0000_12095 [Aquimarina sp. RZ0]